MAFLASSHSPFAAPGFGARLLHAAIQALSTAASIPSRIVARRHLLRELSSMSDYELSDIGLTRSDLSDTTALPLGSEIGGFLAERVQGRRHIQRR